MQSTTRSNPAFSARSAALRDRAAGIAINALWREPSQLQQFADIIAALPNAKDTQIIGWDFHDGELAFVLAGKSLDPSKLVRAFTKVSWARNVAAEPTRQPNQMKLTLDIAWQAGA